jgi:hypothetical protein
MASCDSAFPRLASSSIVCFHRAIIRTCVPTERESGVDAKVLATDSKVHDNPSPQRVQSSVVQLRWDIRMLLLCACNCLR